MGIQKGGNRAKSLFWKTPPKKVTIGEIITSPLPGPAPRDAELATLEAVLLVAREPLTSRKLARLTGLADGTKVRTLVRALNKLYDKEGSSFRIEEVAGGYQLLTRAKFAPWLMRLHGVQGGVQLSAPALETLAVVAYRQPVLRAEIEAIRGVQCGEVLRQLRERGLVRVVRRSQELGRPLLYGTTRKFLQTFGLRHIDELPRAELLRTARKTLSGTDNRTLNQYHRFPAAEEETNVKTLATIDPMEAQHHLPYSPQALSPARNQREDEDDFDEFEDEEEYDEEDEDEDEDDWEDEDFEDEDDEDLEEEDFEDASWEEVDDDEEEEDEEEDEDLDDDDEDDWEEEDEDWDDEDEDYEEEDD
jgi:segregation and condensation protein B